MKVGPSERLGDLSRERWLKARCYTASRTEKCLFPIMGLGVKAFEVTEGCWLAGDVPPESCLSTSAVKEFYTFM